MVVRTPETACSKLYNTLSEAAVWQGRKRWGVLAEKETHTPEIRVGCCLLARGPERCYECARIHLSPQLCLYLQGHEMVGKCCQIQRKE